MQKNLSIIFALLCSFALSAQEKAFKRIERSYQKAKYERCIALSQKKVKKHRSEPIPHLYIGLSYYQLYIEADRERTRARYLKKALSSIAKAKQKDRNQKLRPFDDDLSKLHDNAIEEANRLYENKKVRDSKGIYVLLAKVYKDTLPNYRKILDESFVKRPSEIQESPVATSNESRTRSLLSRSQLVERARSFIGVNYRWGGESPSGFDCSGFNTYLYRQAGIEIPHNAQRQSQLGDAVALEDTRPGDLVFFGKRYGTSFNVSHTGMVYSNQDGKLMIIHCPNRGVTIEGDGDVSWDKYWKKRYLFAKRII